MYGPRLKVGAVRFLTCVLNKEYNITNLLDNVGSLKTSTMIPV